MHYLLRPYGQFYSFNSNDQKKERCFIEIEMTLFKCNMMIATKVTSNA